jgi:hypothetical protein
MRSHSLKEADGIGIAHGATDAGISATETILTTLPSGQGIRAASSTAAKLDSEPSTANKIFIVFLIDFHVVWLCNALLPGSCAMLVPRKNPCPAMHGLSLVGKITRLGAEKSAR